MVLENKATTRATDRLDLVKRLFAVAISIGVGSSLLGADWLKKGQLPSSTHDFEHLARLALALFATVLSWDGYLASVQKKPLNDRTRFTIDVLLVILYMILIIRSDTSWFWLPTLCVIFSLYVSWDVASIWAYPSVFACDHRTGQSRLFAILRVYGFAILDRAGIDRGPFISAIWAGYFVVLWCLFRRVYASPSEWWGLAAAFVGLYFYRRDKERIGGDGMRGFKMWQRVLIILGLVASALLLPQVTIKV
jgi:hypothetical protein